MKSKVDSAGNKYIEMTYNESTKNHKGINQRDDDTQNHACTQQMKKVVQ